VYRLISSSDVTVLILYLIAAAVKMCNMYFGRYRTSTYQCFRASCCPHHDAGKDTRLHRNASMYLLNHMVSQTPKDHNFENQHQEFLNSYQLILLGLVYHVPCLPPQHFTFSGKMSFSFSFKTCTSHTL
jgi:hypothetical protein